MQGLKMEFPPEDTLIIEEQGFTMSTIDVGPDNGV